MEFTKTYDIAGGDADIILNVVEQFKEKAAVQVDADAVYNGTTGTVQLVQSNDRDLPLSKWHPLPETPLTLLTDDSSLLSTFAFTAKFAAVRILVGDATAGELTITSKFKK